MALQFSFNLQYTQFFSMLSNRCISHVQKSQDTKRSTDSTDMAGGMIAIMAKMGGAFNLVTHSNASSGAKNAAKTVVILQDVFDAGTTYYTCLWNTLNLSSCQLICVKLSQKRQAVAISELIVIVPRHSCHPWQTMMGFSHDMPWPPCCYPQKISVPPFQSSNFRPIWGKLGPTLLQRSSKIYLHTALTATAEIAGPQPISRLT